MALFGAWDDLSNFGQITDIRVFFHLADDVWDAVCTHLGQTGEHIRLLGAVPASAIPAACGLAVLPDGSSLTPIHATQVGLVWRMARRITAFHSGVLEENFQDIDPWATSATGLADEVEGDKKRVAPAMSSGVKERVLKMSALLDQSDDSELLPPGAAEIERWTQAYLVLMGAHPDETEEPTANQLAALAKRTLTLDQAPYAEFAVWLPYERKTAKNIKCRVFTPLGDGTFLQRELPGPSSYLGWTASWKVFRTACLMLGIASMASLEAYARHIEKLVVQWPQCWGLIYAADDLMRAERWEKYRRLFKLDSAHGREVPRDWDPHRPWSCVMFHATKDSLFWNEKVHIPASCWMASGGKGAPTVASEAAVVSHLPGVWREDNHNPGNEGGERKKQSNRDKRQAKKRRAQEEREELKRLRGGHPNADKGGKGASGAKGKGKSKDQSGEPICFSWDSNQGVCADVPPGGACKNAVKRAHKCRICLSPSHRSGECNKQQ